MEYERGAENLPVGTNMSTGSPNAAATHVAREDCPHLADPEWEALQRLATVIGKAAVATMLHTLSPIEHHGVALGFIMKKQREVAARATASTPSTPPAESLILHVNSYVGREGETLLRWLVEVDTANTARRIVDPLTKVAFAMSCLGGRARSWAYGRLLTDPTCFSTYEVFKEELRQAFESPQNEFRSRAEFLDLQQGKHDVHAYAQRARYLVSNIVTNPIDEATKVVTFTKGFKDGPVKTYLFREYPRTETLQAVSAGQTQRLETTVETLSILTRTDTGLQYQKMALESPPTLASEITSLPAMSWKRFARDLHDGRIEQICILSDVERMKSEAEELKQLVTEGADALSAKSKKERLDEQNWESLKSSPLYEVLREYKDVLPDDIPVELPQDKGAQHEIDLVPGTKYCVTRQWPLPREQVKAIDDFFESRRKAGQVRESKSPQSASTFCVKKAQGGWRIGHAYNKLNDATVLAQTPIPRKYEIIDSMALSTIFSALDLRDRFYKILMRESDIPLTAVSTPSGMLWEWLCIFGASEKTVLGCLVGKNGVRPDPGKVRVINEWPTPSNVKELRQFLGLATYLCKYVSNYAGKIHPLSQLLKNDAAWDWTAECQQAFDVVQQGLTEAPILAVAVQDRPFYVVCDASDLAVGCALMQHDHDERDRVVYYQSRQLKPAERNYPVHDKELLAMKYALAKLRVCLRGSRSFVVYTDHASLRTAIKSPHISQEWRDGYHSLRGTTSRLSTNLEG
ncbi:unnamed protein product [Phytophthora fragariaefolia]|uniref:Unnamed protein product n=1 Tax=Phytophthora fragariaefolia TaxID=1490495 RepID=A0A9W6XK74_9STRA|nr:unnamed protein product [Phytophthora fragariaefolia]